MTTFTVEIHKENVTRLKKSVQPEITLDMPSVPGLAISCGLKVCQAHILSK